MKSRKSQSRPGGAGGDALARERRKVVARLADEIGGAEPGIGALRFSPELRAQFIEAIANVERNETRASRKRPRARAPVATGIEAGESPDHPLRAIRCAAEKELMDRLEARHGHLLALARDHARVAEMARSDRTAFPLSPETSPRLYQIAGRVAAVLRFSAPIRIACTRETQPSACVAGCAGRGAGTVVLLSSGAIELLDDSELAFLIGHELAHVILRSESLTCCLLSADGGAPLPVEAAAMLARYRKKLELTADRFGLLACGDFAAAARCLVRVRLGLSPANFRPDITALMRDLAAAMDDQAAADASRFSHPLLALRLRALECFARSEMAKRHGYAAGDGPLLSDADLEEEVAALLMRTRRHPIERKGVALMEVVAMGGLLVGKADGRVEGDELRAMVRVLRRDFTDYPEEVLPKSPELVRPVLDAAIEVVASECDEAERRQVVARLAEVAVADGTLLTAESAPILEIAGRLGFQAADAYRIIVDVVQSAPPVGDPTPRNLLVEERGAGSSEPPAGG